MRPSIELLCFTILLTAWGCHRGPAYPTATVTGKVTIDGRAVPRGYVTFTPAGGTHGPVTGGPILDGAYRCERVPAGTHTVTFIAQAAETDTIRDQIGTEHQVPRSILPPDHDAGIEVQIAPGEVARDFSLQSGT